MYLSTWPWELVEGKVPVDEFVEKVPEAAGGIPQGRHHGVRRGARATAAAAAAAMGLTP